MALQTLPCAVPVPGATAAMDTTPTPTTSVTVDAAGEYLSYVFRATENMVVSHVGFAPGTVSGSGTVDVRIETVSTTTGIPTGTLWATNTNNAGAALVSNTYIVLALTASATINAGEIFAVKVGYNSGTSVQIRYLNNFGYVLSNNFPYAVYNIGADTKSPAEQAAMIALGSSASAFYKLPNSFPVTTTNARSANNTTFSAHGMRFKVPFRGRAIGIICGINVNPGDFTYGMYSDADSELSSSSTAQDANILFNGTYNNCRLTFDSPVTLEPDTWYRAALWPTSATNVTLVTATIPSAALVQASWWGNNGHYTTRSTGGTWVDTATTEVPMMDILFDQLDDGVSAGGGLKLAGRGGLAG